MVFPRAPRTVVVWQQHPGYVAAFAVDVLLSFGLGVSTLMSDPSRFTAASYAALRQLGMDNWGFTLLLGALMLGIGAATSTRVTAVVLTLMAMIYLVVAIWFGISAHGDEMASWWGTILFGCLAAWHVTQANEYRRVIPKRALAVVPDPSDPDLEL